MNSATSTTTPDPAATEAAQRPFRVLQRAFEEQRLPHGILLHGEDLAALEAIALRLAALLLHSEPTRLRHHPDFHTLRPRGKARFINIGTEAERTGGDWPPNSMRRLIHDLNLSSTAGGHKTALIYEADRMNAPTANSFLHTLEEPPPETTLLLLTTRPHALLPTIRSRCHNFRIPAALAPIADESWQSWLEDYRLWIDTLRNQKLDRRAACESVLTAYGLIARFSSTLEALAAGAQKNEIENAPDDLDEAQREALKTTVAKGIRARLLGEIEAATRSAALARTASPEDTERAVRQLDRATSELEHVTRLLDVQLNENAALEHFLLRSLRIWTNRP